MPHRVRGPLAALAVVALLVPPALVACSRTSIEDYELGVVRGGRGPSSDASVPDGDAADARTITDASLAPDRVAFIDAGCTSLLQPGAPAPMQGYCSTQANVAPTRAPSHPVATWTTQVGTYAPAEMVVDADGRVYVANCSLTSDAGPTNELECNKLVALNADGGIAWSHTLQGDPSGLFLAPDGKLHLAADSTLYAFDSSGHMTTVGALPVNVQYNLVGADEASTASSPTTGDRRPTAS